MDECDTLLISDDFPYLKQLPSAATSEAALFFIIEMLKVSFFI